jgi:hypothetical protein
MADFARWGEAVGRSLGWSEGDFLAAYEANRASANEVAVEASPVALAVRGLAAQKNAWTGTAKELLTLLAEQAGESATRDKSWPKNANSLSGKLRRAAPALRKCGLEITFDRTTSKRSITICGIGADRAGETSSSPSSASSPHQATGHNGRPHKELRLNFGSDAADDGDRHGTVMGRHQSSSCEAAGNSDKTNSGLNLGDVTAPPDDDHDGNDDLSAAFSGPAEEIDEEGEWEG